MNPANVRAAMPANVAATADGSIKEHGLAAHHHRLTDWAIKDGTVLEAPQSRWPVIIAVLCTGALHYALPESISAGPRWLLVVVLSVLLVPSVLTYQARQHRVNAFLGHTIAGIITAFMVWSISLLVSALTHKGPHTPDAVGLLRAAAFLWITNVLVFALWYWRLDAGGPTARDMRAGHPCGSFLFPQMTLDKDPDVESGKNPWSPHFVDYVFLAFNTSTALSPADTAALSRWAKLLMMAQSMISLTIIVLLAARAVNILQ